MARLIFWALLGLVVVWLVRRALRGPPERGALKQADTLVRCAHCGVLLPRREALELEARDYCSQDHANRGPEGS